MAARRTSTSRSCDSVARSSATSSRSPARSNAAGMATSMARLHPGVQNIDCRTAEWGHARLRPTGGPITIRTGRSTPRQALVDCRHGPSRRNRAGRSRGSSAGHIPDCSTSPRARCRNVPAARRDASRARARRQHRRSSWPPTASSSSIPGGIPGTATASSASRASARRRSPPSSTPTGTSITRAATDGSRPRIRRPGSIRRARSTAIAPGGFVARNLEAAQQRPPDAKPDPARGD